MEPPRPGATDQNVWKTGVRGLSPAGDGVVTADGALGIGSRMQDVQAQGADAPADWELVERARRDPAAFGAIYRLHYQAIGRYLYRRIGDRTVTEDLVAETFLVALREIPRFEWRGIPILHWLYRIATNAANRWARRRRFLDLARVREPVAGERPDRAWLHRALRRLPTRFQEVLALHYFADLPVESMARLLDVAPGTVKSRLARARDALRARLSSEEKP